MLKNFRTDNSLPYNLYTVQKLLANLIFKTQLDIREIFTPNISQATVFAGTEKPDGVDSFTKDFRLLDEIESNNLFCFSFGRDTCNTDQSCCLKDPITKSTLGGTSSHCQEEHVALDINRFTAGCGELYDELKGPHLNRESGQVAS